MISDMIKKYLNFCWARVKKMLNKKIKGQKKKNGKSFITRTTRDTLYNRQKFVVNWLVKAELNRIWFHMLEFSVYWANLFNERTENEKKQNTKKKSKNRKKKKKRKKKLLKMTRKRESFNDKRISHTERSTHTRSVLIIL